jgi:hypothetical protein
MHLVFEHDSESTIQYEKIQEEHVQQKYWLERTRIALILFI